MMGWNPSSGNPSKRRRQDVGTNQGDEDDDSGGSYGRRYANRLVGLPPPRGMIDQSFNQQLLLHSNMNHPLSSPRTTTSLRGLPLPNLSGSASSSDPFSNSILSSSAPPQQALATANYHRDPWPLSGNNLGGGPSLWANEAMEARLQAQAQLQLQAEMQMQMQMQRQARGQGRSLVASALTPTQRELEFLRRGSSGLPSFAAAASGSQHLPNLPIRVEHPIRVEYPIRMAAQQASTAASLAIAPEALNFSSSEHLRSRKRSASFVEEEDDEEAPGPATSGVANDKLTGRRPVVLYMPCDDAVISRYQCLARKQMELFEAEEIDVEAGAQGRNRGIVMGQVGIRCIHCSHLYPRRRTKSSTFYPSKLKSIYQTAQNMANTHLTSTCQFIPQEIRDELIKLSHEKKTSAGGGKEYWSDGARILGVCETESHLRFDPHNNDYPGAAKKDPRRE